MKYFYILPLLLLTGCSSESTLSVIGDKDEMQYRSEINRKRERIRGCYMDYSTEKTKVDLTITLVIDADGDVTKMDFLSNHNMNDDLKDCLVEVVEKMDFDKPQHGGTIEVKSHLNFNLTKTNRRYR